MGQVMPVVMHAVERAHSGRAGDQRDCISGHAALVMYPIQGQ